jgi:hypothetical protein
VWNKKRDDKENKIKQKVYQVKKERESEEERKKKPERPNIALEVSGPVCFRRSIILRLFVGILIPASKCVEITSN